MHLSAPTKTARFAPGGIRHVTRDKVPGTTELASEMRFDRTRLSRCHHHARMPDLCMCDLFCGQLNCCSATVRRYGASAISFWWRQPESSQNGRHRRAPSSIRPAVTVDENFRRMLTGLRVSSLRPLSPFMHQSQEIRFRLAPVPLVACHEVRYAPFPDGGDVSPYDHHSSKIPRVRVRRV